MASAANKLEEIEDLMVCPFFLHSKCSKGDNCEFAHEMTRILPKNVPCVFYRIGLCKYGAKCWFSHGENTNKPIAVEDESNCSKDKIKMRYCFRNSNKSNLKLKAIVADIRKAYIDMMNETDRKEISATDKLPMEMCAYIDDGKCVLGEMCPCLHGLYCQFCWKYCLNPNDPQQRQNHTESCEKKFEQDMELSFLMHNSYDKICDICKENVMQKPFEHERKFGILEHCEHSFCYPCIKTWWDSNKADKKKEVTCPTCREPFDLISPSENWFGSGIDKTKLISKHKKTLKEKHCKLFKFGSGHCPFNDNCFYQHEVRDPNSVQEELSPIIIRRPPRRDPNYNADMPDDFDIASYIVD